MAAALLMGMGIYLWAGVWLLIIIILSIFLLIRRKIKRYIVFPILIIIGYVLLYTASLTDSFEKILLKESGSYEVSGKVYKVQETDYGYKLWLKDVAVNVEGRFIDAGNALAYTSGRYEKGDRLKIFGECELFETPSNPGEFNLRNYYKSLDVDFKVSEEWVEVIEKNKNVFYRLSDVISKKLTNSFFAIANERYASVFCAMLLGNKHDLDEGINKLFSGGGIGHILAISGLHISVIGMGLYKFLKRIGCGYWVAMLISGGVLIFYGMMTGNGVSTIRAVIMFWVLAYSHVAGRTYDLVSGASLAGLLMLMDCPLLIYNGGFWLSFMAIAGVGGINPVIIRIFEVKNSVLKALVSGISIQLATVPVIMFLYYEIPIYSILINLVVVPLVTYVMIFALIGGIVGCFNEFFGRFFVSIAVYILKLYEILCEKSLDLPGAVWVCGKPMLWQVIVYYALMFVCLYFCINRLQKRYFIGVLLCAIIIISRFNNSFKAVFLDVGQGDGIYIRNGDSAILVDCGSSDNSSLYEYSLEPFLMSEGKGTIDYVFVTHTDSDHCSGIKDLLEKNKLHIEVLVLPITENADEEQTELLELARQRGTEIVYIYAGLSLELDGLKFTCLHPKSDYVPGDKNGNSIVLLVQYKELSMLLTGDIGEREERYIENIPKVDILKVAHHGSKNSSSYDFLQASAPKYAIISCGLDNSYGHPNVETLERLEEVDCDILTTTKCGAIIVEYKKALKVYGFAK